MSVSNASGWYSLEDLNPRTVMEVSCFRAPANRSVVYSVVIEIRQSFGGFVSNRTLVQYEWRYLVNHSIGIGAKFSYLLGSCRAAIAVDNDTHVIVNEAQDGDIIVAAFPKIPPNDIVRPIPFGEHGNLASPAGKVGLEFGTQITNLVRVKQTQVRPLFLCFVEIMLRQR